MNVQQVQESSPAFWPLLSHMLEDILSLTPSLPLFYSDGADARTENRISLLLPKPLPFIAQHESQEKMARTHSGLSPDVPPVTAARFSKE